MTELVIKTIHLNTKRENFRLHVFDNGSTYATQVMLQNLKRQGLIDTLYQADQNLGLETARDRLLWTTETDYFVCVDNDCLPSPPKDGKDWLDQLIDLMEKYEDFGAISMRTQVMIGTGNIFAEADEVGDNIVEFPHPGGSYRIMRTDIVRQVNGWDGGTKGRGAEERFIGNKLHEVGYRTAFATNIQTLHLFGVRTQTSERWGYTENLRPEDTGHSDISHPALTNGDDFEEVAAYSGEDLAREYFL
jgi:GT2 family glycosyltransferase